MEVPVKWVIIDIDTNNFIPLIVSLTQYKDTTEWGIAPGRERDGQRFHSPCSHNPYVHWNKRYHVNLSHTKLEPMMTNSFILLIDEVEVDNTNRVMQLNSFEWFFLSCNVRRMKNLVECYVVRKELQLYSHLYGHSNFVYL